MSNPFESRASGLEKLVEARLALDASHQPREVPVPQQPVRPSLQPKVQEFAHITGEVLEQFRHVTEADKIIKAGQLAREGGRVAKPQGDAKAIIEAASRARGRTDDDLQLPEKGTLARAIIDSAARGVNWAR